jgi:hypothetical protein
MQFLRRHVGGVDWTTAELLHVVHFPAELLSVASWDLEQHVPQGVSGRIAWGIYAFLVSWPQNGKRGSSLRARAISFCKSLTEASEIWSVASPSKE